MIEEKIIFMEKFKKLSDNLRELTEKMSNFIKEQQEIVDKEVAKDPTMVLKLMKKGKYAKDEWF